MSLIAPLYFRELIRLYGGLSEVNRLVRWLNYYGFKWRRELKEAGVDPRRSFLAYVLERSIEAGGASPVERPGRRPANTFLLQALETVEALDGLSIVAVARGKVDEDAVSVVYDAFLSSEFYMFLLIALYRLTRVERFKSLIMPYAFKGVELEILKGFNQNAVPHEPSYPLPGALRDLCAAEFEGALSIYLFHRSRALLEDLKCLKKSVKELIITALPLEAPTSLVALGAATGFTSFYKADEIGEVMRQMGFKKVKIYLKKPYYLAAWRPG